jgi:hypothetical protein
VATILAVRPKVTNTETRKRSIQTLPLTQTSPSQSTGFRPKTSTVPSNTLERFRPMQAFSAVLNGRGERPHSHRVMRSELFAIERSAETDLLKIFLKLSDQDIFEGRFETLHHCNDAVRELEERFVLGVEVLANDTIEAMQEIIYQHWSREQIELELAIE